MFLSAWERIYLGEISFLFAVSAFILLAGLFPYGSGVHQWKDVKKWFYLQLGIGLMCAFLAIIISVNKNSTALYIFPNDVKTQPIPVNVTDSINEKLDKLLKTIK